MFQVVFKLFYFVGVGNPIRNNNLERIMMIVAIFCS